MRIKKLKKIIYNDFYSLKGIDERTKKLFEIFLDVSRTANRNKKLILANAGFAVDLAVGKITRNHEDIDMVVLEKDLNWFKNLFKRLSYKIGCLESNDPRYSFTIEKEGFHGEVDSIRIEGEKVSDQGDLGGERWIWPIKGSELIWARKIDDVLLKFVSPIAIYDFKKRQQKRDIKRKKEYQDFRILEKRFPFLKK